MVLVVVRPTVQQLQKSIPAIDGLESVELDNDILLDLLENFHSQRGITFHTPSFKQIENSEYSTCNNSPWPAMSITGGKCKLMCDHCQAKILEPMLDVSTPDGLRAEVEQQLMLGAKGMLLSGGSNHRNELEFDAFYPVIKRVKQDYPYFQIAVHTGLATKQQADELYECGVDIAMMDVIGDQKTITQVYHLKRQVADFQQSLNYLCSSGMRVVPHIVMGLHYGEFLGEQAALAMVSESDCDALVLVAAMPQYAKVTKPFRSPDVHHIGEFMLHARRQNPELPIILGCARPAGVARSHIDSYAVLAGLDGIAHPAEGIIELSRQLGRVSRIESGCCSVNTLSDLALVAPRQQGLPNIQIVHG